MSSSHTQRTFSNKINQFYKTCVITGAAHGLDAAHIIDKNICQKLNNNFLKFHSYNGILLRKDIHKIFDEHQWCFNPYDIQENTTDDKYIYIGIVSKPGIILPHEMRNKKYYKIGKSSYQLIYLRYLEYLNYKKTTTDFKDYWEINIQYIKNIDKQGYIYDIDKDSLMLETIDSIS
jgi:hypothetical protein